MAVVRKKAPLPPIFFPVSCLKQYYGEMVKESQKSVHKFSDTRTSLTTALYALYKVYL